MFLFWCMQDLHRDLNNWVIQELLLADLAKTQYTRDDERRTLFSHKP